MLHFTSFCSENLKLQIINFDEFMKISNFSFAHEFSIIF